MVRLTIAVLSPFETAALSVAEGALDEVMVFARALSADEISRLAVRK